MWSEWNCFWWRWRANLFQLWSFGFITRWSVAKPLYRKLTKCCAKLFANRCSSRHDAKFIVKHVGATRFHRISKTWRWCEWSRLCYRWCGRFTYASIRVQLEIYMQSVSIKVPVISKALLLQRLSMRLCLTVSSADGNDCNNWCKTLWAMVKGTKWQNGNFKKEIAHEDAKVKAPSTWTESTAPVGETSITANPFGPGSNGSS